MIYYLVISSILSTRQKGLSFEAITDGISILAKLQILKLMLVRLKYDFGNCNMPDFCFIQTCRQKLKDS